MIHAEISIYPLGTSSTSTSFYIAKGIDAIKDVEGIRYEITPMGTLLESKNLEKIFEVTEKMTEVIHNLNVGRIEILLKIDSRKDKETKLEDKIKSVKKFLEP